MSSATGKSNGSDVFVPICNNCKNYFKNAKCMAFKNGIPDVILDGENNHSKPLKNQKNDIVYEPIR